MAGQVVFGGGILKNKVDYSLIHSITDGFNHIMLSTALSIE